MRVIQLSTRSTLGEYDSRPPLARCVWYITWYLRSSCCSETHVLLFMRPRSFRSSTLDITHVRKCTRPSLLYRTASYEKMGVGLGTRVIQGDIPGPHCVSANYVSTKCVTIVTLIEVAMVIYYKPTLIIS